jgi:hypothetical protein
VCGKISVKISRVAKADELCGHVRGAHIHAVIFHQNDGRLSVNAQHRVFTVHSRMLTIEPAARTTALSTERCGAIGTIKMLRNSGGRIGPPAASAYAVEPVAVEAIRPSAT